MADGRFNVNFLASVATFAVAGCVAPASQPSVDTGGQAKVAMSSTVETAGDLAAYYRVLEQGGGTLFTLAPAKSKIRIYAFRGGTRKLGHNHVLHAPSFTGFFYLPAANTAEARFDLVFRLDQLVFDDPEIRSTLGEAFASTMSPEAIAGTRQHFLGQNNFQSETFPFVRIHSMGIVGEAPKFAAKIKIELHGESREMWVPITVDGLPGHITATGAFVLRQTDFGVKPYSILGDLIAVSNEVMIEFQVQGN